MMKQETKMKVLDHENNENANSDAYDDPWNNYIRKAHFWWFSTDFNDACNCHNNICYDRTFVWKHTCTSAYFDLVALSKAK